jgi:hypothetical protein
MQKSLCGADKKSRYKQCIGFAPNEGACNHDAGCWADAGSSLREKKQPTRKSVRAARYVLIWVLLTK